MSALERRLQLLLDSHRYELVADEARRSGRSVAAVIRDAIDLTYARPNVEQRLAILEDLFERTDQQSYPEESPEEIKAAIEAQYDRPGLRGSASRDAG